MKFLKVRASCRINTAIRPIKIQDSSNCAFCVILIEFVKFIKFKATCLKFRAIRPMCVFCQFNRIDEIS